MRLIEWVHRAGKPHHLSIISSKRRKRVNIACMNVQGCNNAAKRECVGKMFEERGLGM